MPRRKSIALGIAVLADAVQLGLSPVFGPGALSIPDDALDLAVAVALLITVGWSWRLILALSIELVPGLALFPTWSAFVVMLRAVEPRASLEEAAASATNTGAGTGPARELSKPPSKGA